jgi:hypothetical protein
MNAAKEAQETKESVDGTLFDNSKVTPIENTPNKVTPM